MTDDIIEIDIDRRQFLATAGVLGGAALAGCTGNNDANGGSGPTDKINEAKDKGKKVRLTVSLPAEIWSLDPALWTDTSSAIVGSVIYDEIVSLDGTQHLTPQLATEVPSPTNGGTSYDYTLKKGLKFHNGDTVTVEDFKYSVDWIINPDHNTPVASRLPKLESTEIIDDRTLRLNLSAPVGAFNFWMTRGMEGIVPKGAHGDPQAAKNPIGIASDLSRDPSGAGTGAFKFVEWESGSHVLVEKFDDYWMDGVPKVDELKFSFISEDATRIANLVSGKAHVIPRVPPKDYNQLKSNPAIKAKSIAGPSTQVIYTNLIDSGDNPMSNRNNRRAVMYGVDREEIIDSVFYGNAVPQAGVWFPDSEWTSPELRGKKLHDVNKARTELEKAGNPDGFEMNMIATKGSWYKKVAVTIQSQLKQIGIDVNVSTVEKSTLLETVYGTTTWHAAVEDWTQSMPLITYWFDAGFAGNNHNHNNWHHPSPNLRDPYVPSGPPAPEGVRDKYSNGHEWFAAQLSKAQKELDKKKRKELCWTMDEYLVDNAIQINLAYKNKQTAWRKGIEGFSMGTFSNEFRKLDNN